MGSELNLQQSQHHKMSHQWLPETQHSTSKSISVAQHIEAFSNQMMNQPLAQRESQSMSQPQPEISITHESETSQYFIIHCQHGSCSVGGCLQRKISKKDFKQLQLYKIKNNLVSSFLSEGCLPTVPNVTNYNLQKY